jgi:hypothetical protein
MWLALIAAARADTDTTPVCYPEPDAVVPADGQTDVPVDVRPMVVIGEQCDTVYTRTFTIVRGEGDAAEVLATATVLGTSDQVVTLVPSAPLPADTVLHILGVGFEGAVMTFTTGSALVQGLSGLPTVDVTSATWYTPSDHVVMLVDAVPADDPDGLSVLRLQTHDDAKVWVADGPRTDVVFDDRATTDADACAWLTQLDGAGRERTVEDCATPEVVDNAQDTGAPGGRGCGGRGALGLGGLALLARRRHRARLLAG